MANNDDIPTLLDAEEAFEQGDVETAMLICEGLIGEDERKAPVEVLYLAAECLLEIQEPEEALHYLDLALTSAPGEEVLIHARGICLFEVSRFEEATFCFEEVSQSDTAIGEAFYYLAVLAERQGDEEAAARLYAQAVDCDPENLVPPRDWPIKAVRKIFGEVVEDLPPLLREWMEKIESVVAELPTDEDLKRSGSTVSPLVLCMFDGGEPCSPVGDSPTDWLSSSPTRVQVFRRNLGKCALDDYELHQELLEAVLWELTEFLGLSEDHLIEFGLDPRETEDPLDS
jgi:predicted Zn-dependent protease with MMP-like domain